MSSKPPQKKNPYSTVSASKRRAQRQAKMAQQAAARRSLSITGSDTYAIQDEIAQRREKAAAAAKKAQIDDAELTAQLLANPTKFVSEAELRADYAYVLKDLRSMGLLSAGLVVLLVVLAQILPR